MNLAEWFFFHRNRKITKRKFAKDIGIHPQTAFRIIEREHTPSLFLAVAIEKYTEGEVTLLELLSERDRAKYMNITLRKHESKDEAI